MHHVRVPVTGAGPQEGDLLEGELAVPEGAVGVVAFAHGSGSSRHSPRNQAVAVALQRKGLATLLVDLLTTGEEEIDQRTRAYRFDLSLLARRLDAVVEWLGKDQGTARLPIGLFGASTGAGAALITAARQPDRVRTVVSRGGRVDLAADALADVHCPVLLIVGGRDEQVLTLNAEARRIIPAPSTVEVVRGATHLFEEPGALEQVCELAGAWFLRHLSPEAPPGATELTAGPQDPDAG